MKSLIIILSVLASVHAYSGGINCKQCPAESTACAPRKDCELDFVNRDCSSKNKSVCTAIHDSNFAGVRCCDVLSTQLVNCVDYNW